MIKSCRLIGARLSNYYKTLNVDQNASTQDIKKSFNELAKKYHPDRAQSPDNNLRSDQQFIKVKKAYDTLKDPDLRKQYDFELIHGNLHERRQFYYYYPEETSQQSARKKMMFFLNKIGVLIVVVYLLNQYIQPMTPHEIRRQNILLSMENIESGASVQEKRRKIYAEEAKEKQVTSNVVEMRKIPISPETSRAKNARKNSMEGIGGISKEAPQAPAPIPKESYI